MSQELYERLTADFPVEAYGVDKSRGFPLTTLQAQWIKERLNTVFGIFGWRFEENFVEKENGIICHGLLVVSYSSDGTDNNFKARAVQATGGCAFKEKGQTISDPYKSAATEALSKACSYIGIGNEMYKGLVSTEEVSKPRGKLEVACKSVAAATTIQELNLLKDRIESRKWEKNELDELEKRIKLKEKEVK